MVPVEAQACGRPVVVLAQGGALESVIDGLTGVHVHEASVEAFADALSDVSKRSWDAAAIRAHAEGFGKARFQHEFQLVLDETVSEHSSPEEDPRGEQIPAGPANRCKQGRKRPARSYAAREEQ
jgi:hypothetical protein